MKKISFLLIVLIISACEKEIFPELDDSFQVVSIEAMITDQGTKQQVFVTRSQPYFENQFPPMVTGAEVYITDQDNEVYSFVEGNNSYEWISPDGNPFGKIGDSYVLTVIVDGQTYVSFSQMNPVPPIDSITWEFDVKNDFIVEDFYTAQFFARDLVGPGNAYWIKAYKNGAFLNQPSEINVAFDAGFSQGGNVDGVNFIQPIRQAINPFDLNQNNQVLAPYLPGDSVSVEIYSISQEMFFFLLQVQNQINRPGGFGELFASPITNVPTNIVNLDENSDHRPVGYFNVSAVSSSGSRLTEEKAADARIKYENGF